MAERGRVKREKRQGTVSTGFLNFPCHTSPPSKSRERKGRIHLVKEEESDGLKTVTPSQAEEVHSEPATQRSDEPVSRMRSNC
jgi:hypothetical protein